MDPTPIEDQPLVRCAWQEVPTPSVDGHWWKSYRTVTVPLGVAVDGVKRGVASIIWDT